MHTWIPRYARRTSLYREIHVRECFSRLREKTDSRLISQTSTCIGRRGKKKKESYFRHGAHFISFHRALTDRRWIKPNIGRGWASLNLRNLPGVHYRSVREIQRRRELRFAAIRLIRSPISHIIRRSIDSYVDTPRKIRRKTRARLVRFEASYDAASASLQLYTRESC